MTTDSTAVLGEDYQPISLIGLEFAFRIRIYFGERRRFEPTTPMGGRFYVPPLSGDISGPRLQGRVIPHSGADFARGRSDNASELNAHYMLESSDGTPIYINNRGFLYGRDDAGLPAKFASKTQETLTEGAETSWKIAPDTYFFCVPVFDTPVGRHDWLTRHVFIGRGRRVPSPDHTCFDYYIVDNA